MIRDMHQDMVVWMPDPLLERIYRELRPQNLRNYSDDETRWKAARLKSVARERRGRIQAGTYAFKPERKKRTK